MKKLSFLPLLAAAGMFSAPSANAAVAFHNHILIDNFEEAGFGNTLAPATMTLTAPSALGGVRTVDVISGAAVHNITLFDDSVTITAGQTDISYGPGLAYDFESPGLGAFEVEVSDIGFGTFDITVQVSDGTNTESFVQNASTPGIYFFAKNAFPGVDMTNVDSINVSVAQASTIGAGINGVIDIKELRAVPEPSRAIFLVFGLGALLLRRRR